MSLRGAFVRFFVAAILAVVAALSVASAEEIPLVDKDGHYIAYIDTNDDFTIFLWDGEPAAYVHDSGRAQLIYSFSGEHLGWYAEGIIRDLTGDALGAREGMLEVPRRVPSLKGLKRLKPLRGPRRVADLQPVFSNYYSNTSLEAGLRGAADSRPATPPSSSRGAGAYVGTGMKWWITRVENGGRIVVLSDGSRWGIQPLDVIHTMLWLPVDDVTVTAARVPSGSYRYVLTHERDRRQVKAEYLGR